jgi:hypothetical protein
MKVSEKVALELIALAIVVVNAVKEVKIAEIQQSDN